MTGNKARLEELGRVLGAEPYALGHQTFVVQMLEPLQCCNGTGVVELDVRLVLIEETAVPLVHERREAVRGEVNGKTVLHCRIGCDDLFNDGFPFTPCPCLADLIHIDAGLVECSLVDQHAVGCCFGGVGDELAFLVGGECHHGGQVLLLHRLDIGDVILDWLQAVDNHRQSVGGDTCKVGRVAAADHQLEFLVILVVGDNLEVQLHMRVGLQVVIHGLQKDIGLIGVIEPQYRKGHIFFRTLFLGSRCKHSRSGEQQDHQCHDYFFHADPPYLD
ncbi:hypothetical protein SDC9_45932 [bioreactor metagenome]|uniref:Uncharacterized protein n=1 Tax=bioreactor metagenome TaxID=1076179 RepID=A0A644W7K8_9ZZZZ